MVPAAVRRLSGLLLLSGFGLLPLPAWVQQGQAAAPEQWRYVSHNGEWWYWLPQNRWVYWRNEKWNDYSPQSFVAKGSPVAVGQSTLVASANRAAGDQNEVGPFYGHSLSTWGSSPAADMEVGPLYGHALPSQVFGRRSWRSGDIRPYYGHAASSSY
jgi:hypothetical protein